MRGNRRNIARPTLTGNRNDCVAGPDYWASKRPRPELLLSPPRRHMHLGDGQFLQLCDVGFTLKAA